MTLLTEYKFNIDNAEFSELKVKITKRSIFGKLHLAEEAELKSLRTKQINMTAYLNRKNELITYRKDCDRLKAMQSIYESIDQISSDYQLSDQAYTHINVEQLQQAKEKLGNLILREV